MYAPQLNAGTTTEIAGVGTAYPKVATAFAAPDEG